MTAPESGMRPQPGSPTVASTRQSPPDAGGHGVLRAVVPGLATGADPLLSLSAAQLLAGYAAGDLSPVAVTTAVIAHIQRCEPHVCATYAFDPASALAQARESEQRWQQGQARALEGVPVTLKENLATQGVPVPLGTAATDLVPAAQDSPPAARLREAGAVLLAKTTMPDYGMLSSGLSSVHALARNPWDLDLNPGGSSAGAAAAAAAGYGPLHVGTDIGGSIRLPAAWCGLVGFKPSLGRVPIDAPYPGRVAGPLTRTVRDAALMMGPLSRPDARDAMSLPPQTLDWLALERDLRGLRIGLWLEPGWGLPLDPAVRTVVEQAAERFAQAGAHVEPIGPWMDRSVIDGIDRFWRMRFWVDLQRMDVARRDRILPYIRQWAEGARGLSGEQVFEGQAQMLHLRQRTVQALAGVDYLLSPTAPNLPFPAGWPSPTRDVQRPLEHIAYTLPFNMSEQPAISLNAGYTLQGLPVGVQLAGQRFDDLGVLQLAAAWERMRPVQQPWPFEPGP